MVRFFYWNEMIYLLIIIKEIISYLYSFLKLDYFYWDLHNFGY